MSRYAFQRRLGGGAWTVVFEFEAHNLEDAKVRALERFVSGVDRASHGDTPFRIMEIVFEGTPEETGCFREPTVQEQELMDVMEAGRMRGWLYSGAMEQDLQQITGEEGRSD